MILFQSGSKASVFNTEGKIIVLLVKFLLDKFRK